jgi:hypothetical protein
MGGFFRRVIRVFANPVSQPPAQVVTTQPAATTTIAGTKTSGKVRGAGSGITGTIMTDATGLEEEANVSKTELGGTTKKKKKYA